VVVHYVLHRNRDKPSVRRAKNSLKKYLYYLKIFGYKRRGYFVASVILYVCFLLIAPALAKAFGKEESFGELFLAQISLLYAIFMSPTPGGSGVGELGGLAVFASFLEPFELGVFVILWRLISLCPMLAKRYETVALCLLFPVLFYLAFSKLNLWFLVLPALFILSLVRSLRGWLLAGFLSFFFSLLWIRIAMVDYGGVFPPVAYVLIILWSHLPSVAVAPLQPPPATLYLGGDGGAQIPLSLWGISLAPCG